MGTTGGQSFAPPFLTVILERSKDYSIGHYEKDKDYNAHGSTIGNEGKTNEVGVSAHKSQ